MNRDTKLILRGRFCNANRTWLSLSLILSVFLVQCSGSDDQREFEREAMQESNEITETDGSGALAGEHDPDDWRIAPFFQGLVDIDPAFPNPVLTNEDVFIHVEIPGVASVSRLEALVRFEDGWFGELEVVDDPSTLTVLRFSAIRLGRNQNPESALGLKRILIFDGNGNIISYGDIRVE